MGRLRHIGSKRYDTAASRETVGFRAPRRAGHVAMMQTIESARPRRDGIKRPVESDAAEPFAARPPTRARAALLGVLIVGWFCLNLVTSAGRFLIYSPDLHIGVEAASSFARLFGSLVLFLVPDDPAKPRLRWIAASFIVLGAGGLVFGYLQPVVGDDLATNAAMYLSSYVWSIAGLLILVGLLPAIPPSLDPRRLAGLLAATFAIPGALLALPIHLPPLIRTTDLGAEILLDRPLLDGMTGWHWAVSALPLAIAVAAAAAGARRLAADALSGQLLLALVLFAGAQLHDTLWPSAYSPVLTASDILELTFAAVVAVAGIIELRRVGTERAELLDREQESSRQLRHLSALKTDFTAMMAHELGNPLAAIRRQADLIDRGRLDGEDRERALAAIQAEAKLLTQLVLDVQESARIERADFDIDLRPCPVEAILADAASYARTLPGNHPLQLTGTVGRVVADPDRIGQVLRNLLSNAAKYSEPGEPIALRASRVGDRVRIEVADLGPGVDPDDLARIFGKFERGRAGDVRQPGLGLGLYVARRIVVAHGGDLEVAAFTGSGSVFSFELEAGR